MKDLVENCLSSIESFQNTLHYGNQIPPRFRHAQGKTPFFLKFAWQTQPAAGFINIKPPGGWNLREAIHLTLRKVKGMNKGHTRTPSEGYKDMGSIYLMKRNGANQHERNPPQIFILYNKMMSKHTFVKCNPHLC